MSKKYSFLYVYIIICFLIISIFPGCNYNKDYKLLQYPDYIAEEQPGWSLPACIEMWQDYNWLCNWDTTIPFASQQEIATYIEGLSGNLLQNTKSAVDHYTDHTGYIVIQNSDESGLNKCIEFFTGCLHQKDPAIIPFASGDYSVLLLFIRYRVHVDIWANESPEFKYLSVHDPVHGASQEHTRISLLVNFLPIDDKYTFVAGEEEPSWDFDGYLEFLKACGTYYGGPEIYIPEGSTFVRIRYPNGCNTLAHGKSDQIIWESNGLTGQIRLELYKNDTFKGTIAENLPIGNGSYNWTVGEYQGGNVPTCDDYKIKVSMMDDSYDDLSNVNFSMGDMNVTSPNGGEAWDQESIRYITWDNSYFSGDVHLYLRKTIPGTDYLIEENVKNTGIYEWIVGMCTRNGERGIIEPGDCYKIKVVSVDNPDLKSSSNQTFEITEPLPPGITVTSPNGGENIVGGSTLEITWTWTGNVENVKIEFSTNNGTSWQFIVESTENDGFYTYNVPIPNAQKDNCLVRISEIDGDPSDVSDAVFSVVLPPSITVLSPNGGEEWQMDSVHNITWNASGLSNNLNIALQQNGISVALIAENIDPGLGSYAWTVGQFIQGTASAGSGYMIKIKEIGEAVSDTSDANFSLIE